MSASRAALRVRAAGRRSTAELAAAQAPQRWNLCQPGEDGWLEATHQLVGDGAFAGDLATTRVTVGGGAKAVVRGISAMPLRRGSSAAVTRLAVGGTLLWLPGPLVPHRDAKHTSAMDIRVSEGGELLSAATLVFGRTGWGEVGAFRELGFRTRLRYAGELAFAEETVLEPGSIEGMAEPGRYEALVSLLSVGPRLGSLSFGCHAGDDCLVGASQLRTGGSAVRALFSHLGAARDFLEAVERRARAVLDEPSQGAC